MAGGAPDYGFRFDATGDYYEPDEETAPIVRRVLRMAAEGATLYQITNALNREGVAPPTSKTRRGDKWNATFIRRMIRDDVYRPHAYAELEGFVQEGLLKPAVLMALDPDKSYGIKWANRWRYKTTKRLVPDGKGGKEPRRNHEITERPRAEWIAVPVPDLGVPRDVADAARAGLGENKAPSNAGRRFWELSGGIAVCGECGRHMTPQTATPGKGRPKTHYYYGCRHKYRGGDCENRKNVRAEKLEAKVAAFVSDLLSDEGRLLKEVDALIERGRGALRNPEPEEKAWAKRLEEAETKRAKYQEMYAADAMTLDELKSKLAELEAIKSQARQAAKDAQTRQDRLSQLERDREAIRALYRERALREGLAGFEPEQRREIYKRLRLTVKVYPEGAVGVAGELPLALSYLESPFMVVEDESQRLVTGEGEDMELEGVLTIKRGTSTTSAPRPLGCSEREARWPRGLILARY